MVWLRPIPLIARIFPVNTATSLQNETPPRMRWRVGRDDWIRTSDLFVPNEARYRAALHPVLYFFPADLMVQKKARGEPGLGREDRIRTCDPMVPNHVFYRAELPPGVAKCTVLWVHLVRKKRAVRGGFEPPVRLYTVRRFSKPVISATHPPHLHEGFHLRMHYV
jgi:hypothetical protein